MAVQRKVLNPCLPTALPQELYLAQRALKRCSGNQEFNNKSTARRLSFACQNVLSTMGKKVTLKQVLQPVSLKKRWGRTGREHVRTIPRQQQPTFARFSRCQNQRLCLHGDTFLLLFSFQNNCSGWYRNESRFSTAQIQRVQIRRGNKQTKKNKNK